jgi:hypothetical protein
MAFEPIDGKLMDRIEALYTPERWKFFSNDQKADRYMGWAYVLRGDLTFDEAFPQTVYGGTV